MTPALTVEDVAQQLQVAAKTVRKLAQQGTLRAFRVGRAWRFEPSALAQFKARQTFMPVDATPIPAHKPQHKPVRLAVRRRFV